MYLTLAEVGSSAGGLYCCGSYNSTSKQCQHANAGSMDPFTIRAGYALFPNTSTPLDSYDGSASNGSVSCLLSEDTASENAKAASDRTTIGAATGVPLGVALIIAIVCIIFLWRLVKKLEKELAAMQSHVGDGGLVHEHTYLPLCQGSAVSSPDMSSFGSTRKVNPSPERQELGV